MQTNNHTNQPTKKHLAKIISVVNQKGGVGKTTTTMNLATSLAIMDKKILVIDLDPQSNATTGLGIDASDFEESSYDFLINQGKGPETIQVSSIPGLDIIPTTMDLSGAEVELANLEGREFYLKKALADKVQLYDYIFIDCPPSLGLLTINALVASTEVLIPLQCEYFALEGLSHLIRTLNLVKESMNPDLEIKGIVLTMYDARNNLSKMVEQDVRQHYVDKVYKTVIPRNVKVSEAPSHGLPVILYDTVGLGAQAYIRLAAEIIKQDGVLNNE